MLLRFLLWQFGRQLIAASQHNPGVQQQLSGRRLVFQLQTADGRIARHFIVAASCIISRPGRLAHADLSLVFHNRRAARYCLDPQQRQLVLLTGIQNGDIEFRGNPALSLWLQALLDALDQPTVQCLPPSASRDPSARSQQPH